MVKWVRLLPFCPYFYQKRQPLGQWLFPNYPNSFCLFIYLWVIKMKTILITTLTGLLLVVIIGLTTHNFGLVLRLNTQTETIEGNVYWRQLHYRDCLCVRKSHIVADLQQYLNNTGIARYGAGEVDNIIGNKFKKAIRNYMFDNMAEQYFAKE